MKKTLTTGQGVTGVTLDLNIRDIIVLNDSLVSKLALRKECRAAIQTYDNWTAEYTEPTEASEGDPIKFSSLQWRRREELTDNYFRTTYPELVKKLQIDGKISRSDVCYPIEQPFNNEDWDNLYNFLSKINTGPECQATIFDAE